MAIHSAMTFPKAAGILAACSTACGAAGAGVGALVGWLTPEYYRAVFRKTADLNQVSVGTGLGLTQGLLVGIVVGVVIVAILTWQHVRLCARR